MNHNSIEYQILREIAQKRGYFDTISGSHDREILVGRRHYPRQRIEQVCSQMTDQGLIDESITMTGASYHITEKGKEIYFRTKEQRLSYRIKLGGLIIAGITVLLSLMRWVWQVI